MIDMSTVKLMYAQRARTECKIIQFLVFLQAQSDMDTPEKKYYKISDASELLGVPATTLRFWEKEFGNLRPKRNAKGTRFYSQADMERLQMIRYLVKDRGLHIEAAKREIRTNPAGTEKRARAVARLRDIRAKLVGMLDALNSRR
jgi:DNA-binding transcriptional MerR regulator